MGARDAVVEGYEIAAVDPWAPIQPGARGGLGVADDPVPACGRRQALEVGGRVVGEPRRLGRRDRGRVHERGAPPSILLIPGLEVEVDARDVHRRAAGERTGRES